MNTNIKALYGLTLGLVLGTARGATLPPEKLLSDDTLAVFTVPDFASAKAVAAKQPAQKLWQDPAMKPFKDKFFKKWESDVTGPLEQQFGVKFADYRDLAQGQLTLAVTQNGWNGQGDARPGFLLLLDSKDKSGQLKTNLAALKQKWVDSGKVAKTDKIREVEFTTYILASDDLRKSLDKAFPNAGPEKEDEDSPKAKRAGKKLELLVGQSDSLLIIGDSAKEIEKVLVHQSGGSAPSLSDQSDFSSQQAALFRDSIGYGWIHLKPLIGTLTKMLSKNAGGADEDSPRQGPRPDKIMAAIGFSGLQAFGVSMRDLGEGSLLQAQVAIPESERRGLFKMLTFSAKDSDPPPFVPADAVKFTRSRIDLQKAIATLEAALVEAMPQAAGVIKLVMDNAGKDKDPDFDLRKNLFANLGDDVISYQKAPRSQTLAGLSSAPTLFLVGSPRAEQAANAIKALAAVMPQQSSKVKEREFLGRKVFSLPLPPTAGPAGKPVEQNISYVASGGYVAFSTDAALLEEYLRSSESKVKALRETPGLGQAAQKVDGMNTGLFGYENQLETVRAPVEALRKDSGSLSALFGMTPFAGHLGLGDDGKFKDWVDFSLLPPFDQIAKYFSFAVWSGTTTGQGMTFKMFSPRPPGMGN